MKKRDVDRIEIDAGDLSSIVERAKGALEAREHEKLKMAVETLIFLTRELEAKGASIERLRQIVFGVKTEKTSKVLGRKKGKGKPGDKPTERPGHGRNGTQAYLGADKVKVAHGALQHKCRCPHCRRGKLYRQKEPIKILRVRGIAPLSATVYELERLRCNACGEIFKASAPADVGEETYDESATAMIALLKYGCGLPFYRLAKLQGSLGIPLPASTQWELVKRGAESLTPAHEELIDQAAQGELVHNDDTVAKILDMAEMEPEPGERTGLFTTGIISSCEGRRSALFFTGREHAGENLAAMLSRRAEELPRPIQMCDALSRNTTGNEAGEVDTIVANCLAHARRKFVEVAASFPEQCGHVLDTIGDVYRNDALAREQGMSADKRLAFHKAQSGPLLKDLEKWLRAQLDEHMVEPNSGLGQAITYTIKHYSKLTLFLREPGAPLDNNIVERALKRPILHRKNSLFFKTKTGARVADLFMSLIHSAELAKADPFDYLIELLRHAGQMAENPSAWMPWNYRKTLTESSPGPEPPS